MGPAPSLESLAVVGLEDAYLEDTQGLQVSTQEDWDRDGIEWKARLGIGPGEAIRLVGGVEKVIGELAIRR